MSELCAQYSGVIADKRQTITFSPADKELMGFVDEQYYRMAIENIVDNASKYTPEGGEIKISSRTVDGFACVEVEDTGVGIASENIPVLFEKFHRISNDLSHRVSGSGLGLYWVEKVIDLHQGKIEVDSLLGKGTAFRIFVPVGVGNA